MQLAWMYTFNSLDFPTAAAKGKRYVMHNNQIYSANMHLEIPLLISVVTVTNFLERITMQYYVRAPKTHAITPTVSNN